RAELRGCGRRGPGAGDERRGRVHAVRRRARDGAPARLTTRGLGATERGGPGRRSRGSARAGGSRREERTMPLRPRLPNKFAYDAFMQREGLPVHEAVVGVEDVIALPRQPWARLGGSGTFIQLRGTFESQRGVDIVEIPGGGALEPEKHLYEKEMFVLQGRGVTQVWQGDGPKLTFEWNEGSVFAFPRNTTHRLFNAGQEPAILMAVTTAPEVI